jgi:SsrA-binding protein
MTLDTTPMSTLNRKARFNYTITDTFEVGIVLTGAEVKSVRAGQINLDEAYARVKDGELWLMGAHIAPFSGAPANDASPTTPRKLLMHKKELEKIALKLQTENLTLIPLKTYLTHNRIKVELGLAKGKKKFDKRESIKERDLDRATRRKLG